MNGYTETRAVALHVGNALLNKRVLDHVTQKHYLEDSIELLYQFLEVETFFFSGGNFSGGRTYKSSQSGDHNRDCSTKRLACRHVRNRIRKFNSLYFWVFECE